MNMSFRTKWASLLAGCCALALAGCQGVAGTSDAGLLSDGGFAGDAGAADAGTAATDGGSAATDAGQVLWVIPTISLSPGGSAELAPTLPPGTLTGGVFDVLPVDPDTGAALPSLPAGVTLDRQTGRLTAAADAGVASVSDLRFTYDDLH